MQDRSERRTQDGPEVLSPMSEQKRREMWQELEGKQILSVVTLRTGEQYYSIDGRHQVSSQLPKTPEKETTSFVTIRYLAKTEVPGQPPEAILPAPLSADLNVSEIAQVERFVNPYIEARFVGIAAQQTHSFQKLQTESRESRELVTAGR